MNGLKKAIRDNLPESWEKILRKHKILIKFVNYAYESLPYYMKGGSYMKNDSYRRRKYQLGIDRIRHLYANTPIYCCFCGCFLNIDGIDWYAIYDEIKEYEQNYK